MLMIGKLSCPGPSGLSKSFLVFPTAISNVYIKNEKMRKRKKDAKDKRRKRKKDAKEKREVNDFLHKVGLMREARIIIPA